MADFTINVFSTSSNELGLSELEFFAPDLELELNGIIAVTISDDDGVLDPDDLSGTSVTIVSNGDPQGEITEIRYRTLTLEQAGEETRELRVAVISRDRTANELLIPVDENGRILEPDPADVLRGWKMTLPLSDSKAVLDIDAEEVTNTPPVAADDVVTVNEGETTSYNVLDGAADGTGEDTDADGDTLTVVSASNGTPIAIGTPVNIAGVGQVQLSADGSLTLQADPSTESLGEGDEASADITYTIADASGEESTATITLTVQGVNDDPTAGDVATSVNEDGSVAVDLQGNADDVDGDDLTIALGTPANGTVAFDGEEFRYTPNADFAGEDTFTYTVSDGNGGSATGTVTVTVAPVNDAPVAQAQTVTGDEDTVISGQLVATDIDDDDATLTYSLVGNAANGNVVVNGDGSFEYTPDPDFNGSDGFTFRAADPSGATSSLRTVILQVNDVDEPNRAPVAVDDTITLTDRSQIIANLVFGSGNDSDPDGDTPRVQSASIEGTALNIGAATVVAGVGTFALNTGGSLNFTPDPSLAVLDEGDVATFTGSYTIADPDGATATAAINLVVEGVNDAPETQPDSAVVPFDTATTIDVLGNDTDINANDVLTLLNVSNPANGTAAIVGGQVVYTPDVGYTGSDSFTYRVTDGTQERVDEVTVSVEAPDNTAPVAQSGSIILDEDTANLGQLLYSDGETGNDALTVEIVDDVTNGTLVLGVEGAFTYTPDSDYNGSDSFTYRVSDGELSSAVQTISITVDPVNDLPTVPGRIIGVSENNFEFSFDLLSGVQDIDGDDLDVEDVVVAAADGRTVQGVSVNEETGVLSFDAGQFEDLAADDELELTVTFDVNDGTGITEGTTVITVQGENDDPVGVEDFTSVQQGQTTTIDVVANDTDVDGDTLSLGVVAPPTQGEGTIDIVDGELVFTAAPDFVGQVTLGYQVTDGNGGSGTSQVTFTVTDTPNADPVAADFAVGTNEDAPVVIDFASNVSDADGDTLIVTPNSASVSFVDGSFVYTPAPDVFGTDSFTYTVSDGNGGSDGGTVTVNIAAVNDDPTAAGASVSVAEDGSVAVDLDGLVDDVDGDALTIALGEASNGTIAFDGEEYRYTPDADYNGPDSFSYTVSDGNGGTASATVDIDVTAVNDAPAAADDSFAIGEAGSVTGNLITGAGGASADSDVEGDSLNVVSVFDSNGNALQLTNGNILPEGGQLAVGADGAVFFDPLGAFDSLSAGETGSISFTYVISDGDLTDTGAVSITVSGSDTPNSDPVAGDFSIATDEDVATTIDFDGNTSDADGDTLVITPSNGSQGTVAFVDGSFVYTPDADANGTDSFTYIVDDGNGGTDTGTVTVDIAAVNDAPVAADTSATVAEDGSVALDLASLVSDVDGDVLTITPLGAGFGSITEDNGQFVYTPAPDFNGADSFTYEVSDGTTITTGTVSLDVTAVNDSPVADDDVETTDADTAVTVDVLANDLDVDGDPLTVTVAPDALPASQGAISVGVDGQITYDPNGAFDLLPLGEEATVRFDYTVSDGDLTDTASVSIEIAGTFVDEPGPIIVEGTGRSEFVVGTSEDEIIKGLGGSDRLYGEGGADVFDFTDLADDPARTRDSIYDFDSDDSILMADDGFEVQLGSRQAIIRTDDGDTIRVAGTFNSVEELNISVLADDFFL